MIQQNTKSIVYLRRSTSQLKFIILPQGLLKIELYELKTIQRKISFTDHPGHLFLHRFNCVGRAKTTTPAKNNSAKHKKLEIEMKDLGPKIEKEMQKAKVEIEKAKVEMKEYKGFVDGLDKDGLINKKEGYTIRHKNGELIINGKKQPADVYSKYRSFLEKHTKFNIKKSNDDFNIDTDDDD